jgi:phospho-N-acetylmuramoyl-pentapeptide-transferase
MEIELFTLVTILLSAILISMLISVPIIHLLYKFNITRRVDVDFSAIIEGRKSKAGTPVMGGLIIVISILLLNLIFNFNGSTKVPLLVFAISAAIGGIDDFLNIYGHERRHTPLSRINKLIKVHKSWSYRIWYLLSYPWQAYKSFFYMLGSNPGKGIQAHEKILINSIAAFGVYFWMVNHTGWPDPTKLFFPFGISFDLGLLMIPFVILTVLTMTNAVNIADGMDGLSAGMLVPAFIALMVIAVLEGNSHMAIIAATAVGGCIAYLYFNIPPARVQMGDVGSLSLGTLMALIALEMRMPFILLFVGLPFLIEFMSSLIQGIARRIVGRRIFLMAPLHHHLELIGWREDKVVMRFWLLAIFSAFLAIWVYLLY